MASGLVFPKHVVLEFMIVLLTLLATLQLTFALMRAAFLATSRQSVVVAFLVCSMPSFCA